ncbi:MAG: hypothetical protein KDG52_11700 [Rhodocyclaceae bacterium]|nr:hypothetical protein [Rhodocyclaceae bacterium]
MNSANHPNRPATWLDLVRAAHDGGAGVRIHPVRPSTGGPRLAISLASRMLHSNDGRITVFADGDAAARFLTLAGITRWEPGEMLPAARIAAGRAQCLGLRSGRLDG